MRLIFDFFRFSVIYVTALFAFMYVLVGPQESTSTTNLAYSSDCVYDISKDITFTHNIKRTRNYDYYIESIGSKAKQCNVSIQALIDGNWREGKGSFIYGPDTSDNSACYMAAEKAKSDALQSYSPETISASIRNRCETRS